MTNLMISIEIFSLWCNRPTRAYATSLLRFRGYRHTALCRFPLDEWSARRRDLYMTTHHVHKGQTSMSPAGFEPAVPASERLGFE